jgi:hypothetical protein
MTVVDDVLSALIGFGSMARPRFEQPDWEADSGLAVTR